MALRPHIGKPLLATALALGAAMAAQAAPTTFIALDNVANGGTRANTNAALADFKAAAGTLGTQGFEGMADGAVPGTFNVGTVGVSFSSLTSQPDFTKITVGTGGFSTYAAEGSHFIESLADQGQSYFSMSFASPVSALAFYLSDLSDWAQPPTTADGLEIILLRDNAPDEVLPLLAPNIVPRQMVDGNLAFFGVVDAANPIRGFRLHDPASNPDGDAIGLDVLMVSQAATRIPLPATGALLAAGLLALGATRRRR